MMEGLPEPWKHGWMAIFYISGMVVQYQILKITRIYTKMIGAEASRGRTGSAFIYRLYDIQLIPWVEYYKISLRSIIYFWRN